MYRVEYYCPRKAPTWKPLTGFLGIPRTFPTFESAQSTADSLIWQYHSARVIDPFGQIVYQV